MKILRISLRNIASLEGTHTVDFTRDPLRAAGLFAISGITGSGKSTFLDALCLALYERTPRLTAVRGAVKLADGGDSISQKDPANLLRRGTGEGFAEVAFIGVDEASYTARWTVRRARNRPEGSLQNPEMTLFRGDVPPGANGTIEQGGRKTEVLPVIAAKVGLSFEQFTRAVLLAQNDFATFLKADDKERAEILQALTGTERFEAISVAVFTRSSAEQSDVTGIEARLAGNAPLAAEARLEAESASAVAERAWKLAGDAVTEREAHAAWFQRCAELSRQAGEALLALRERIATRDAAASRRIELLHTEEAGCEGRPLRDTARRLQGEVAAAERSRDAAAKAEGVARADCAAGEKKLGEAETTFASAKGALESARPQLLQARELDAKLSPLAGHLAAATRDRETAETNLKHLAASRDALSSRRDEAGKERAPLAVKREALDPLIAFATDAAAWLHRLDHAATCRTSLDDAAAKLVLREKEEKLRTEAASAERANEPGMHEAAKAAIVAFDLADASARAFDGEKIARVRSEADAARTALRELENHFRELEIVSSQATAVEDEIAALKVQNDDDAKALTELHEKRIPEAEKVAEAACHAFSLAEAAVTNEAIRLRGKLTAGHPCPVCGATDHPHSDQPPAAEGAALRALRADCAPKEKDLRALREAGAGLAAARSHRLAQEAERIKSLAALNARLTALGAIRHEHPVAAAILALPPGERSSALGAQLAAHQQTLSDAEVADSARRAAEKLRDERRTERDTATAALDALEKRLAKFAGQLTGLRVAREAAQGTRANREELLRIALDDLASLFTGLAESRVAWDRDAAEFRRTFAAEIAAFLTLEKRLAELNASIRETEAALAPANEAVSRAESEALTKRHTEESARIVYESVRTLRTAIFAARPVDEVEAELSGTLGRATEARDLRIAELEKASHQLTATTEALKGASQALVDATARLTTASAALDAWLAAFAARIGRTFDHLELEKMLARDDAWIKAERAALDAMDGAIRSAEGALAVHQKALAVHTASRPTSDDESTVVTALAALRIALAEAAQRRDTARAFLLADDQRLRDNAVLAAQLSARRALAEPWLKLNDLIGSADGAKFRSIAQRRTLDILLGYANAQLDLLAARYRLERLPESLNLIVLDRDMGEERRSVHSLSGGESFLVSLALALALASLTSNRLRIESLFIDEGFGSLDPETLNTAMNALMQLEAQGRKVGVISHVSEMTDAIPVQIRVVKGRSGASRLVIVPGPAEAVNVVVEDAATTHAAAAIGAIAAQILAILQREHLKGRAKVSTRALREEIGCSPAEFTAARDALSGEVRLDGKSLALM